ncbi:MAG: hypothetical protein CMM93_08165 [Rickettsiales bacterium]|nr:hypothetical protein [Rickettsiales bacterium]|tara:strand:+ start:84 stop:524 length:441 start_codon:yes stop_codon:yes gene_type:complete
MIPLIATAIPVIEKVLDRVLPNEEAREKARSELISLQNSQELKLMEIQMSAILAEASSADPFTSRARPSFLYLMYGIISLAFIGGILGIWWPAETQLAADNINAMFNAIPEPLYVLFGTGYLGYTASRSWDKRTIAKSQKAPLPWQ